MEKVILFIVSFCLLCPSVYAQMIDSDHYQASVRPVKVSIYLEADLVPEDELPLFYELEDEMDRQLLDEYFSISVGSGFFVSDAGHLVTCHHVVDMNIAGSKLNRVLKGLLINIVDEYGYLFGEKEFAGISATLAGLFIEGEIKRFVSLPGGEDLELEMIDSDIDRDLALLRVVEPVETKVMALIRGPDVKKVGEVLSVGYPIPGVLDRYFAEITPALTSGIVSAVRQKQTESESGRQVETIQHTASVSPGNSGGPLLTETGLVAGVNSSLITGANNVYFAISAGELISWLETTSFAGQIKKRSYIPGQGSGEAFNPVTLSFSTSPAGAEVYVDGVRTGTTPLTTQLPGQQEYDIRVSMPGYLDLNDLITVSGDEELVFDYQLEAGAKVVFDKPLPSTIQVAAVQDEREIIFEHNEPMFLPSGAWDISFKGPISNDRTVPVDVADVEIELPPDLFIREITLRLLNLRADSSVYDWRSQTQLSASEDTLLLPYRSAELMITTPNYRDIVLTFSPDFTNVDYQIIVDYQQSSQHKSQRRLSWGLGFLIPGLAVAGTSLLLNYDPVSVALSSTFEIYSVLKYATFSLLVTGTASSIGGLIVTISALGLKNDPDTPVVMEYDFAKSRFR